MLIAFQHTPQIIAVLLVDTFAIIPPESGNSFASLGYKNLYALLVFAQSIANKPAFSTNRPEKFKTYPPISIRIETHLYLAKLC